MTARLEHEPPGPLSRVDHAAVFVLGRMLDVPRSRTRKDALRRVDPLLRGAVDRRIEAALDDARRAAPTFDESDQRKLAVLDIHDRLPDFDKLGDVELIRRTFDRLAEPRPHAAPLVPTGAGLWLRTVGTLLAVVVGVGTFFVYRHLREPAFAALEAPGLPSATAYRDGGKPLQDSAVRAAFSTAVPELALTAINAERRGQPSERPLQSLVRSLRTPALRTALGSPAYTELGHFADTYLAHVHGRIGDPELRTAITRLNAAIVRRGLGYRVVPIDVGGIALGLATFEIGAIEFRRVGRTRVTILLGSRLDSLNAAFASFGLVERDAPFIVVPVDAADRAMVTTYLPLLQDPPAPSLLRAGTAFVTQPYFQAVHDSAHAAMVRDLVRGHCGAALTATNALLAERAHLIGQWSSATGSYGVTITPPRTYEADVAFYERGRRTNPRHSALVSNHEQLGEREHAAAFACARDRLVASYLPGLAQRYVDERRATLIPVSPGILDLVDAYIDEETAKAGMQPTVRSVRAALASLVHSPDTAGLTLTALVHCWMDGGTCLRMDEDAARIVFAELGRELGIPNVGNLRAIGSARIAELYRDLVARDPRTLARAATSAHRRLFGD